VAFAEKKHLNLPEKLIKFVKVRQYYNNDVMIMMI